MKIQWNDRWVYNDSGMKVKNSLSELVGQTIKTISGVEKESEEIVITTESGIAILIDHQQDCCEHVDVYDFEGDPADLIGGIVISAEESTSEGNSPCEYSESNTWTFYKIETSKGGLWIRWLGESNGYYSEQAEVTGGSVIDEEGLAA